LDVGTDVLVCAPVLEDFRLIRTRGLIDDGTLTMDPGSFAALGVEHGDQVRIVSLDS
jgi:arginine/ornithine N-succinyltransferase beta subunit